MTWVLVGIGYAVALIFCLSLRCAAADGDWIANHVLADREKDDELEMRIAASMDYSVYGRWTA